MLVGEVSGALEVQGRENRVISLLLSSHIVDRREHSHGSQTKNILYKHEPRAIAVSLKFQPLKLTSVSLGGPVNNFTKISRLIKYRRLLCSCRPVLLIPVSSFYHLNASSSAGNMRSPAGRGANSQTESVSVGVCAAVP